MDIYSQTVSNNPLGAGVPETVLQLVGVATLRAQVTKITLSFDGVSSTAEPVDVFLLLQDTAGTSSAGTIAKLDVAAPTANLTSRITFTAEPTTDSNEFWRAMIHPQGGLYEINWAIGDKTAPMTPLASPLRIGLKMNAPAAVNVSATIQWVE